MLSKALLGFAVPDKQPSMTAHYKGGLKNASAVLGPLVGGIVAAQARYRSVFMLQTGLTPFAIVAAFTYMPITPTKKKKTGNEESSCLQTENEHSWVVFSASSSVSVFYS